MMTEQQNQTITNQQWIYQQRPETEVTADHYQLTSTSLDPELKPGEVLLKALYFSVDPYMRIQQSAKDTWEEPFPLGSVQGGDTVAEVIAVNDPEGNLRVGDLVTAYNGWQTYAKSLIADVNKIPDLGLPASSYLGVFGLAGKTAYFGLIDSGMPKTGETVLVSGAAGAVGSIVVQLAKLRGCKVVGIAGSQAKIDFLTDELGVDHAINYKSQSSPQAISEALRQASPNGYDIYFDNVGGQITDAAILQMNVNGRIVICGQISQYNGGLDQPEMGPRFLHQVLYKRLRIQGFLARDYKERANEMMAEMAPLVQAGKIKFRETTVQGFENLPQALNDLFYGKNTGKMIVKA